MWGHSTLFSSSIISGSPNWLINSHYFISIHLCFHSKENGNCIILYYIYSDKFFNFFWCIHWPRIANEGIVSCYCYQIFNRLIAFLMGIRFSSSCVFIFFIVFSFSFCMLLMFVICGNYLIEKKIYTVQITGKCICKTFPSSLCLIIRPYVKQSPHKFAQKSLFSHEKLF